MRNLYNVNFNWYEFNLDKDLEEHALVIAESFEEVLEKVLEISADKYLNNVNIQFFGPDRDMVFYSSEIKEKLLEANDF